MNRYVGNVKKINVKNKNSEKHLGKNKNTWAKLGKVGFEVFFVYFCVHSS